MVTPMFSFQGHVSCFLRTCVVDRCGVDAFGCSGLFAVRQTHGPTKVQYDGKAANGEGAVVRFVSPRWVHGCLQVVVTAQQGEVV